MAKVRTLPWTILGRKIGTMTGWDEIGMFIVQLYDFIPTAGIDLPSGTVSVDLESGLVEAYDDAGNIVESKDIVAALSKV